MSHGIYQVVLVVLIAAATTATSLDILDLSSALNNTLCPTKIDYDIDDKRIPRVIKTLKCKESPGTMCAAGKTGVRCCRLRPADNLVFKCAQVTDQVVVQRKDSSQTDIISVPVACMCVAHAVNPAEDES